MLLFQDIAVISMLAIFPLLASHGAEAAAGGEESHAATTWLSGLPAWAQTLAVIGVVATIVLAGRFLIHPALLMIAQTNRRELFTAAALLLVIGIPC
ncbi:MAG: hypothetical protein MI924_34560 [Chloroflexales bacterium]|nr:hypothetical protein [Chloroflexales bacterium]